MKTEVIMKRPLLNTVVRQSNKTELICANDIAKAGDDWRRENGLDRFNLIGFFNTKGTKEFIKELESRYEHVYVSKRGRNGGVWVHPFLAIDLALAVSPVLKTDVYEWVYDHLIKHRNDSGNSYRLMTGAIWERTTQKTFFTTTIQSIAIKIKNACNVTDWQTATEEQLKLRDEIQKTIATILTFMPNVDEAVNFGIRGAIDIFYKKSLK